MRLVLAPRTPHPEATLPDRALLESVRHLSARFPDARLREVTVVRARELDARADATGATRAWLAVESMQVTGSFKVRGALVALDAALRRARADEREARVVSASAGNHGAGVAYAARALGVRATVVVPKSAPRAKKERIASLGAELVVVETPSYDDAEAHAKELAAREGVAFLSPYDDHDVLAGNGASLAFEITRAIGRVPDAAVVPFGGGGLATGLACGFALDAGVAPGEARRVWGAQSEACAAMALSIERGAAVERLEAEDTLADGLEGGIARAAFARAASTVAGVAAVGEAAIARAMACAVRDFGLVLEGSAACALVPFLEGLPSEMRGGDVVAVLTGRNVDARTIARVLAD